MGVWTLRFLEAPAEEDLKRHLALRPEGCRSGLRALSEQMRRLLMDVQRVPLRSSTPSLHLERSDQLSSPPAIAPPCTPRSRPGQAGPTVIVAAPALIDQVPRVKLPILEGL